MDKSPLSPTTSTGPEIYEAPDHCFNDFFSTAQHEEQQTLIHKCSLASSLCSVIGIITYVIIDVCLLAGYLEKLWTALNEISGTDR